MGFIVGTAKTLVPWGAAVNSTDRFNDYVGSKDIGGARLITGGVQAFAYGRAAQLVGEQGLNDLSKAVDKFGSGDIANGIGFSMLTAAEGAATLMLATHGVASVATAVMPNLADRASK
jgi:hypothetical protein